MSNASRVLKELKALGDENIAQHSLRFFKTGKGEYGEGDVFLGIRVPVLRQHAKPYIDLSIEDVEQLLTSKYHEVRLFALIVWVNQYKKADDDQRKQIYDAYLAHTAYINNWDLVDTSAHGIVGAHLFQRSRKKLIALAKSKLLWERRIAMVATYYFIKRDDFQDVFAIAEILIDDPEDLMHKAVGWMLREAGKRDKAILISFLDTHYRQMPRTMLRYAIEKFPEEKRQAYLKGVN